MRERPNHILTHDATFKNLKHEKKGNLLADVVYDGDFLNSQSNNALFKKARDELREAHFGATFLLEEIDKLGAEMNCTGAELLRRVDTQGEKRRPGAAIDKKIYGSVIPSHGQLSSISAQTNRRANDIIAIAQISTASGEGWKYADFRALVRVMLTAFKLTGTAEEWWIKIGIALDAAPLTKMLSVFTVSIITSDPDAIDPKTGKKISEFFQCSIRSFYLFPVRSVLILFQFLFQKNSNLRISSFLFFRLSGKRQKTISIFLPSCLIFPFSRA
jgi:hypothetical protein